MDSVRQGLRTAMIEAAGIGDQLPDYKGEPAIFTRRPTPADAPALMILINPIVSLTDEDGLTSFRPVALYDIATYGAQPDDYRVVERLGFRIRTLFHRQKWAITAAGFHVTAITARGPIPGPTDDEKTVCRVVSLTIQLEELPL